jgi:outer membrane protein OmpA-like peptidoglycan-associated protein
MMRSEAARYLPICAALLLAIAAGSAAAQRLGDEEVNGRILDLIFVVTDLGGQRGDLQVRETAGEIRMELAADVLFDFDKATLRPAAQDALQQVAAIIRRNPGSPVRIEGHTDAKGSEAYNRRLSEQRARAVQEWLASREGLRGVRITMQGFGASRPVAPNKKPDGSDDPEGRQKNRRVEVVVARR